MKRSLPFKYNLIYFYNSLFNISNKAKQFQITQVIKSSVNVIKIVHFEEGKMVRRVFSYSKILCFINRMDPDEMPHFVQSHLSLYCL